MKTPKRLQSLLDEGLIDGVVRQLMSGKEAMVYVVRCGDDTRCAKVYKEATQRSFRQAVDYTENRKVKNTRQARAMAKGTRFGREAQEAAWQSAEVDALYRLAAAGVRVPRPLQLPRRRAADGTGDRRRGRCGAAPERRATSRAEQARAHHATLMREVVRMLCAGVVHGDLSEFNILLGADGPVIIDLPQAVDAAGNNHAQRMLLRDVDNLRDFFGRFAPELLASRYGEEIWDLYQRGALTPETPLTGRFERKAGRWTSAACCARSTMRAPKKRRGACACSRRTEIASIFAWHRSRHAPARGDDPPGRLACLRTIGRETWRLASVFPDVVLRSLLARGHG